MKAKKCLFLTDKELRKLIDDLIDLGAKCQRQKSFAIASRGKPLVSVYDWAYERAQSIFGERKS